jgi:site-specific DNA-methyltransferase (adenine-specific)
MEQGDKWTVYRGDSRDLLGTVDLGSVAAVVTDPPYGISVGKGRTSLGGEHSAKPTVYRTVLAPLVYGDDEPFDPTPLLGLAPKVVLWGANHYAHWLPPSASWLVWDKRRGRGSNDFADCEMAWTNVGGPARLYSHLWSGMIRDSERGEHYHPTQKPEAVMRWAIGLLNLPKGALILDPYMGGGSTGVAALQLGYRFVGMEIEPTYYQTAVRRLREFEANDADIFA